VTTFYPPPPPPSLTRTYPPPPPRLPLPDLKQFLCAAILRFSDRECVCRECETKWRPIFGHKHVGKRHKMAAGTTCEMECKTKWPPTVYPAISTRARDAQWRPLRPAGNTWSVRWSARQNGRLYPAGNTWSVRRKMAASTSGRKHVECEMECETKWLPLSAISTRVRGHKMAASTFGRKHVECEMETNWPPISGRKLVKCENCVAAKIRPETRGF
jgi:hypothetical protein